MDGSGRQDREGERVVTATLMFTDLVGSTALAARLGPARAEELRLEHIALLEQAIEQGDGELVKNTGDGVMAAFANVASAVACAVLIQQLHERRNITADEQLLVRIGLSVGDVTRDRGDYFGMASVEAARLCDSCSGGQILARDTVALLAGERPTGRWRRIAPLSLKGFPAPVPAVEVVWERFDAGRIPLPPRLLDVLGNNFIGRQSTRSMLSELVADSRRHGLRVVAVGGEPGIGKTTLAAHAAREAWQEGAAVLLGRCEELLAAPYAPWIQMLTHLVRNVPEDLLRAHVAGEGGELTRIVPALRDRLAEAPPPTVADAETERYLLWRAVLDLLGRVAAEAPLVMVLDDMHWADTQSVLLLRHLLAAAPRSPILVIVLFRDTELHEAELFTRLLADLHRDARAVRHPLGGLSQDEVDELCRRAAGHDLDEAGQALSHDLQAETAGNPFYIGETLRHLLETGAIYQGADGRWTVRDSLARLDTPQSVREVILRRVERLGPEVERVLTHAAVIGRRFDMSVLGAVCEQDEERLLGLLEEAIRAALLAESTAAGRFFFTHALVHRALYDALGATRRARLHCRVAKAIEGSLPADPGPRVAELAHHWVQAGAAGDRAKAIDLCRQAGEQALGSIAPDEAIRWFELGLGEAGAESDPAARCDLLIGLGEAQRQIGLGEHRATLLEASALAGRLGDGGRAARASLANNRGQVSAFGVVDTERVEALRRALELNQGADSARRALLMSLLALEHQNDPDHRRRWELSERALELARESGEPRTLARVLRDHVLATCAPETLARRRERVLELRRAAERVHDPGSVFWSCWLSLMTHVEAGEFDTTPALLDRMTAIAQELAQPSLQWFATYPAAGIALLRGDFEQAELGANQALGFGNAAQQPDAFMVYGAQIGHIRVHQDGIETTLPLIERLVEANPGIPGWEAALARSLCWAGREAEALAIVERGAARSYAVPNDNFRTTTLSLFAEAAVMCDAPPPALALLDELIEPFAEQFVWNGGTGYGHASLWMGALCAGLGRHAQADRWFTVALDRHERAGLRLYTARTELAWGEALLARGADARAREHLGRAFAIARESDLHAIAERARGQGVLA